MRKKLKRSQRIVAAVAAGMIVAGVVGGSAASLGSVSVTQLGSGSGVIAACDTNGMTISWVVSSISYVAADGEYEYTQVGLSNVNAACDTSAYSLSLATGTSALLKTQTGTLTVASGNATITLSGGGVPVKASATTRVAIVLSGTT